MKQYISMIDNVPLFEGINADDLVRSLTCLSAQVIPVHQGQVILRQGDPAVKLGVVLRGGAHVMTGDEQGNHTIIAVIHEKELFGDTFACAGVQALPSSVVAAQDGLVLLLEHERVITGCRQGCMAHSRLVTNLLRAIAGKNLKLNQKLNIVTQKTTREKLYAYLLVQQNMAGTARFRIPFDRQKLADYLGVERSAMSAELGKMKRAGLIDYWKNEFELLRPLSEARGEAHHG